MSWDLQHAHIPWLIHFIRLALKDVAEGGTLAEEVVSTIRTAQAFGTQNALANLYDIPIQKALSVDRRAAISQGFGLAAFFFSMYAAYALGQFFPPPFSLCYLSSNNVTAIY